MRAPDKTADRPGWTRCPASRVTDSGAGVRAVGEGGGVAWESSIFGYRAEVSIDAREPSPSPRWKACRPWRASSSRNPWTLPPASNAATLPSGIRTRIKYLPRSRLVGRQRNRNVHAVKGSKIGGGDVSTADQLAPRYSRWQRLPACGQVTRKYPCIAEMSFGAFWKSGCRGCQEVRRTTQKTTATARTAARMA